MLNIIAEDNLEDRIILHIKQQGWILDVEVKTPASCMRVSRFKSWFCFWVQLLASMHRGGSGDDSSCWVSDNDLRDLDWVFSPSFDLAQPISHQAKIITLQPLKRYDNFVVFFWAAICDTSLSIVETNIFTEIK